MKQKKIRKVWALGTPERLVFAINEVTTIGYEDGILSIFSDKDGSILFSGPASQFYTTLE